MKLLTNKKIAIIGAGPGGLTLARLLQMQGADIKVYERDLHKDARPKGATLDLHEESGLNALRHAGLMDAFKANYRPGADKMRILDKTAQVKFEDSPKTEEEIARPEIDRGPLQKILLESLNEGTVLWNRQFTGLTPKNTGWEIQFKTGNNVYADLVIAADGANSKIRPYVTLIKPFYVGIMALEGAVHRSATESPKIHELLNGGKLFVLDDSKSLIVASKGDGSLVFYTSWKEDENWYKESRIDFADKQQALAWFKQEYKGWDNTYLELFENATGTFIPRPQYCMPLNQTWKTLSNLTMLGDAAHLMPPFAGEGVNMAMLDALELSQCLLSDEFADIQSAIAAYEKQMRKRASETAKDTLVATEILHSPNAIANMINMIS